MLSNRNDIRREALRRAGGYTATLSSAGDTTSVIAQTMAYRRYGDDNGLKGWLIYDPADAAADQRRVITAWDDSAGDATVDTLAGAKAGTETVEYYPRDDPGPDEYNETLNRTLSETERVVISSLPTYKGQRDYTFLNAPWIETRNDVLAVWDRNSPNLLDNSNFELWGRGSDSQLHAWDLSGNNATVSRIDGPYGRFAARLTRSGTDAVLSQTIPIPIDQLYGESISVFGRLKSSTASIASIRINDGTDTTSTSEHDGGGDWDEFTATHTVNADAAGPLTIEMRVIDSDGSADFENVAAVVGSEVPDWLEDYGDQHARYQEIDARVLHLGSHVRVVTNGLQSQGSQICVLSRQPYFELSADSGTGGVTDMPFEAAVAGLLTKLAEQHVTGPNAAKWQQIGRLYEPKYMGWRRILASVSRESPTPQRVVVRGA